MRKLSRLMAAALVVGFAASAHAATCTEVLITVTVTAPLTVSLDTATYDGYITLGDVPAGTTKVADDRVVVEDGTLVGIHMYTLQITEEGIPGSWNSGGTAGDETYVLRACFSSATATSGTFAANDVLTLSKQDATADNFGDGSAGDAGINLNYLEERQLWFEFDAPTTTVEIVEQTIKVEVCIKSQ